MINNNNKSTEQHDTIQAITYDACHDYNSRESVKPKMAHKDYQLNSITNFIMSCAIIR
jgi:hypothetical protein